jgi:hypothetical protein
MVVRGTVKIAAISRPGPRTSVLRDENGAEKKSRRRNRRRDRIRGSDPRRCVRTGSNSGSRGHRCKRRRVGHHPRRNRKQHTRSSRGQVVLRLGLGQGKQNPRPLTPPSTNSREADPRAPRSMQAERVPTATRTRSQARSITLSYFGVGGTDPSAGPTKAIQPPATGQVEAEASDPDHPSVS